MHPTRQQESRKIEYFDFLRVIACVAVVAIHVAAQNWYDTDIRSFAWQLFNLCSGLSGWAVPVFVMISGTLFLRGDYSIQKILKKNVFRIATAFLFWSALYAVYEYGMGKLTLKQAVFQFLEGETHLWFLYMIIGLYLLVPLLKPIVQNEKLTCYFLTTSFLFISLLPSIRDWLCQITVAFEYMINLLLDSIAFNIVSVYPFYFVLGYVLYKQEFSPKQRNRIYGFGILCAVVTVLGTSGVSLLKNAPMEFLYEKYSVNIAGMAAAVFIYGKYNFSYAKLGTFGASLIRALSKYSFGAYLVHFLVQNLLQDIGGIHALSFHPALSVPALILLVSSLSFLLSALLNQIPCIRKYLV